MRLVENLKWLRSKNSIQFHLFLEDARINPVTWAGAEDATIDLSPQVLIQISDWVNCSVDQLLKEDLSQVVTQNIKDYVSGKNLRVVVTTVNEGDDGRIELVPESAKAGYANGYSDPEFIRVLPAFNLPFLSKQKKFRAFPVSGDSMPPVSDGSFVIGEYVDNWYSLRDGFPYIVVTKNEGIVFKMVGNEIETKEQIILSSTNPLYQPYRVPITDVLEIWKFVNFISSDMELSSQGSFAYQHAPNTYKTTVA